MWTVYMKEKSAKSWITQVKRQWSQYKMLNVQVWSKHVISNQPLLKYKGKKHNPGNKAFLRSSKIAIQQQEKSNLKMPEKKESW